MSAPPVAQSTSDVRSNFSTRVNELADQAEAAGNAALQSGQRVWQRPGNVSGWKGSLFDLVGIGKAFDRSANAEDFLDAIKDPAKPGVVADLQASVLQGDYLAAYERAFRARHRTPLRSAFHAAARRLGHGDEVGVLRRGVLGYIGGIVKSAKDQAGTVPVSG